MAAARSRSTSASGSGWTMCPVRRSVSRSRRRLPPRPPSRTRRSATADRGRREFDASSGLIRREPASALGSRRPRHRGRGCARLAVHDRDAFRARHGGGLGRRGAGGPPPSAPGGRGVGRRSAPPEIAATSGPSGEFVVDLDWIGDPTAGRRDRRTALYALVGSIAESVTVIRGPSGTPAEELEVLTGGPLGDSPFGSHGHTIRIRLIETPQLLPPE